MRNQLRKRITATLAGMVDKTDVADTLVYALLPEVGRVSDLDDLSAGSVIGDAGGHTWWKCDGWLWSCYCTDSDGAIWDWTAEEILEDAEGGLYLIHANTVGDIHEHE